MLAGHPMLWLSGVCRLEHIQCRLPGCIQEEIPDQPPHICEPYLKLCLILTMLLADVSHDLWCMFAEQ